LKKVVSGRVSEAVFGSLIVSAHHKFCEVIIDAGNRGLGAVEADPNHHRQPREWRGPLIENIVHGTFLGENGSQYHEAAQGM